MITSTRTRTRARSAGLDPYARGGSGNADRLVDAVGTRRRIQALFAIGYREDDLARRLGYTAPRRVFGQQSCVIPFRRNVRVPAAVAAKVTALYDELRDHPGPSSNMRERASRFGWHQPVAWDAADIDDPASMPDESTGEISAESSAESSADAGEVDGVAEDGEAGAERGSCGPVDPWAGSLCRGGRFDPDLWSAERRGATAQAERICAQCPVRRHCLRYALLAPETYCVWGGLGERKRQQVRTKLLDQLDGRPMAGSPELIAVLDRYAPLTTGQPGQLGQTGPIEVVRR